MFMREEITKSLKVLYPFYFVCLLVTPLLLAALINKALFDSREILIYLAWSTIFTVTSYFSKRQFIYQLACCLFFINGTIQLIHWILLHGPLTLTSLLVLSNTNLQEAYDFFELKASIRLLLLIPYSFIFILAIKHKFQTNAGKSTSIISAILLATVLIFIGFDTFKQRFIRKAAPPLVRVIAAYINDADLYKEAGTKQFPKAINANSTNQTKHQTVVLIIGESVNKNHLSLYGYRRETNPRLSKRTDIIAYNNVVSAYSNTLNAVLSMFSNAAIDTSIPAQQQVDLIDVFYSAGFKTYWISNQSPIGIWDNKVSALAQKSDNCIFVNTTANNSFESINTASYDSKLLAPFANALQSDAAKKFIVVHLMGSHASYAKRYPAAFAQFNGNDEHSSLIAAYDNSILYSDFIVDSLLTLLSQQAGNKDQFCTAIYLADHGENVYDENNDVGHGFAGKLPRANVEIPFILWLSPHFIKDSVDALTHFKSIRETPFVSDDLFHAVIDIAHIKTNYFNNARSLFNTAFARNRKRILEDGIEYDLR